uniref:Uncharacterized protein n=1 Tax=Arundo donax TaxID=35708 RepID=A0A0A9BP46_ARUDO
MCLFLAFSKSQQCALIISP